MKTSVRNALLFTLSVLFFVFYDIVKIQAQVFIPFGYYGCTKGKAQIQLSAAAEFNLGTFSNTQVVGNSVTLAAAQTTGTYISPPMGSNCGGGNYPWLNSGWRTTIPFYKELVSSSESTADYTGVASNLMNGLLVYYNFNDASGLPQDRSGNGRHAIASAGLTYSVAGKFQTGVRFAGAASYVSLPTTIASTAKNYTFSFWIRTTATTQGYLFDAADGSNRIIIAPLCYSTCGTNGKISVGYGATVPTIPSTTINSPSDGLWHHLVVTMSKATGNAKVYYDYGTTFTFNTYGATGWNIASDAAIGSRYQEDNHFFNGDVDEYAIWSRALSDAEVLQLYRRGANRLQFQYRSCTSPTCADNPAWRGPDGTTGTYFSELYNNSNQLNRNGNVLSTYPVMLFPNFPSFALPSNTYFQYKAFLDTDNVAYAPDFTFLRFSR